MNKSLRVVVRPLLFLVLFNMLPQIELRPLWVSLLAFVLVGYRLWLDFSGKRMPPRWTVALIQVLACAAVWQHYHTFFGDEAGGTLLTLLTCLKIYELRRKRDFFIAALLCLLVLMSNLLLDQGLMTTLFLMVDIVAIVIFLLALEEESWNWTAWKSFAKSGAALTLKALPLVVLMFVLFPRFNTGFGHNGNVVAKTGVADSLRPGSVASLVQSDELIFRATFLDGNIPPRGQLYWRGAVLDKSNGLNWDRSKPDSRHFIQSMGGPNPDLEIYLEPGSDRFLFSLEDTRYVGFPNAQGYRISPRGGHIFELNEPLQARERYLIQRGETTPERQSPDDYLEVGEPPSDDVRALLKKFQNRSVSEAVRAIRDHFRKDGYRYSLKPPPVTSLDQFLFKTKVGFCEHFAGATATLLRYLKIPSRVVVGFQGGTASYFENYLSVRGHDAHAWVEYFDDQDRRWHRVDPTAEVEPLRVSEGSDSYFQDGRNLMPSWMPAGWLRTYLKSRAFMDEVEANWTGFLLHFDLARQKELLAKLGVEEALFRALAVFLLLSAALILSVLYFFEAQKREPLSTDEKLYRQLLRILTKWRIQKLPNEGPLTLMSKVQSVHPGRSLEVEKILGPLILARYGHETLSESTVTLLRQKLKILNRFRG